MLADVERSLPPLRGVVHAAGVLDDGVLLQQDPERLRRALRPKVPSRFCLRAATPSLSTPSAWPFRR